MIITDVPEEMSFLLNYDQKNTVPRVCLNLLAGTMLYYFYAKYCFKCSKITILLLSPVIPFGLFSINDCIMPELLEYENVLTNVFPF